MKLRLYRTIGGHGVSGYVTALILLRISYIHWCEWDNVLSVIGRILIFRHAENSEVISTPTALLPSPWFCSLQPKR